VPKDCRRNLGFAFDPSHLVLPDGALDVHSVVAVYLRLGSACASPVPHDAA